MRIVSVIVLGVLAAGCAKGDGGARSDSAGGAAATASGGEASGPRGTAVVSGSIRFTGTPPANPTIDMSEEEACKAKHTGTVTDPVVVVKDGKLANVLVYVKSGLPAGARYSAPSTPVELDQEGCLYKPRMVAVMVGQPLRIKNSDPVLHNIKAVPTKNRGFNISQPTEGMQTNRSFSTEEVPIPLQCNVHSWMHADAAVLSNPFFATVGEDGTFRIEGLPAGTYTLEALHEKLGRVEQQVTVGDGESKTVDFTFGPRA